MFHPSVHRRLGAGLAAASLLFGATACGGEDEPTTEDTSSAEETTDVAEEATESATAEESESEGADSSGASPDWAVPATSTGETIATFSAGDIEIEVQQVGTTKATEDGNFVDPDTNKPLLKKGDEVVFVNYVITNTGDPVDLGSSLVSVDAEYEDWQWMQGMDGVTDDALYEKMGVTDGSLDYSKDLPDPPIYTLGTDEQISYAENFKYQKGSKINFEATATPVDAKGDLLHDQGVEGTGSGTIK